MKDVDAWKVIIPRFGRWVDMENDYKTMDTPYTETVWWVFKELFERGLIYEGFKAMHLCPRCGTTLSNFEVALGYQDIEDIAVFVRLPLVDEPGTSLLVWTTTPWTLPGNMAAAVNPDILYTKVRVGNENLIIAKDRIADVLPDEYEFIADMPGSELVGESYVPPFDYFTDVELEHKENAWRVYAADFVTTEDGTGIVHIAPAFGAEDLELAQAEHIPVVHHVGKDGTLVERVRDFRGMQVKPKGEHQRTDRLIAENLNARGTLFKQEKLSHSYPHCWRCDTPLLNYAANSWFVGVTEIRDKLLSENKKIHWVPESIGSRRFNDWLENTRDWAISRDRYWGAPLPVWKGEKSGAVLPIGSIEELRQHLRPAKNSYFVMRHAEARSNVERLANGRPDEKNTLTENGRAAAGAAAEQLADAGIAYIYASPLTRTKETAHIIAEQLGLPPERVIEDERLIENQFGSFEGRSIDEYHAQFPHLADKMTFDQNGVEAWHSVKRRVTETLYDIEDRHENAGVLFVSHGGPIQMLFAGSLGFDDKAAGRAIEAQRFAFATGEVRPLDFVPLPHNDAYELDLHRPYIDDVVLEKNGERFYRISDVFDCWFESGAMPYGQAHYPFENTDVFDPSSGLLKKSRGYPADFIAEGLDQTRGWFYSLLVLGTALFKKSPYKNVIVNGLILAEDGQKMSKRLKNYPDPMDVVNSYGADALRYYLLSSPVVHGEDLNFSEQGVSEIMKKLVLRLENVHAFYATYAAERSDTASAEPIHVLDRWIIARKQELVAEMTERLDAYELDRAARPIMEFVDDLSTWYLRRSRERIKGDDESDKQAALATLRETLMDTTKLLAPFMPFFAEWMYRELRTEDEPESVHLTSWPAAARADSAVLKDMAATRRIVTAALEARAAAGIKVRQPLSTLHAKYDVSSLDETYRALICDEVNVKALEHDAALEQEVALDTELTPELKEEGFVREVVRAVQQARKLAGCNPTEHVAAAIATTPETQALIERHAEMLKRAALMSELTLTDGGDPETAVEGVPFSVTIKM